MDQQAVTINTKAEWQAFLETVQARINHASSRYLIGIAGPPAAGKSFVSGLVQESLSHSIVVPMDGFHLPNHVLEENGLLALKGIPETFNAEGFVNLIQNLKTFSQQTVYAPAFDRQQDASIPNAIVVKPEHDVVIIEGNYLLLQNSPWKAISNSIDEIWYLEVDELVAYQRLIERHTQQFGSETAAKEKIESTDAPNRALIEQTKPSANTLMRMNLMFEPE